jgi:hypothetical protein
MAYVRKPAFKTDIELFADVWMGIKLQPRHLKVMEMVIQGLDILDTNNFSTETIKTSGKVLMAYIQAGLSQTGTPKLPMPGPETRAKTTRGMSQVARVLKAIKQPGGAYNWQLARIALKYTSVISCLRIAGHNIKAQRQYDRNGKPTETWLYYCHD